MTKTPVRGKRTGCFFFASKPQFACLSFPSPQNTSLTVSLLSVRVFSSCCWGCSLTVIPSVLLLSFWAFSYCHSERSEESHNQFLPKTPCYLFLLPFWAFSYYHSECVPRCHSERFFTAILSAAKNPTIPNPLRLPRPIGERGANTSKSGEKTAEISALFYLYVYYVDRGYFSRCFSYFFQM